MALNMQLSVYILNMVEAQRRSSPGVLQRLGGESFIMAVDEAEKGEISQRLNTYCCKLENGVDLVWHFKVQSGDYICLLCFFFFLQINSSQNNLMWAFISNICE